ncbi:Biotin synthase [Crateriforma conspicua]|uniref:Biotin synthase n=2 Tax=Crateriforma conspicua TaxID=2527996 RepID=A0A5C5Y4M9_9PLAN|nr:biotin synthase BioB [Crateriforma conspicua]QDV64541.1 Biotin synthase [Crateriforma conspicua]TWT69938.1 Biotin synthase [Crateriforma conspicua]
MSTTDAATPETLPPVSTDSDVAINAKPMAEPGFYDSLASSVLAGETISREDALAIINASDLDVPAIMAAGFRIRQKHFGRTVQLYFLMNAKSGLCPEDCSYCSQSKVSNAPVPKYNILQRDRLMEAAKLAHERGAKTYCLVISARGPNEREMNAVESIVPEIKAKYDLDICASLGLLDREQADRLFAAGVDRINHNLNTSENYYGHICSTHTYEDRKQTLENVRDAGMEMCSGGIIGMGESHDDIVQMAFDLKELGVHSIPLNILNAIDGTPLEGTQAMSPNDCLKALAMFRFVNPDREIRIAGGREIHLRHMQPMGLYVANSLFVGDYLTTKGQPPQADYDMIRDMGFDITTNIEPVAR